MIGADDDDDQEANDDPADTEVTRHDHLDLAALAADGMGPSVTAARLLGDVKYYPDCRPFLQEEQQPHRMILLTTSGWAFRAGGMEWNASTGVGSTHTDLSTFSKGAVAICTDEELLVVVSDDFWEIP